MEILQNLKSIWIGIGAIVIIQIAVLITVSQTAKMPETAKPEDYSGELTDITNKVDAIVQKVDEVRNGKGESLKLICKNTGMYQLVGEMTCKQIPHFDVGKPDPAPQL